MAFDFNSILANHFGELGGDYVDGDGDGLFDVPYEYQCGFEPDGSETLCETQAYTDPISGIHSLTSPEITKLEYFTDLGVAEVEVFWRESIDTQGHDVSYVLFFTLTDGAGKDTNTKFFSDPITGTSLKANAFDFLPGEYKIRVIATDSEIEVESEPKTIRFDKMERPSTSTSIFTSTPTDSITTVPSTTSDPGESTATSSTPASKLNTSRGRPTSLGIYFPLLAIVFIGFFRKIVKRRRDRKMH